VNARTISYLEAHGTGTELGDPIEIAGLTKAFRRHTPDSQYCAIGFREIEHRSFGGRRRDSKPDQGAAADEGEAAGFFAACGSSKPEYRFAHTPFEVQRVLSEWRRSRSSSKTVVWSEYRRRAGISGFPAPEARTRIYRRGNIPRRLLRRAPLFQVGTTGADYSVREKRRAAACRAQRLVEYMDYHDYRDSELRSIAYTLQTGRDEMGHRLALTAHNARNSTQIAFVSRGRSCRCSRLFHGRHQRESRWLAAALDDDCATDSGAYVPTGIRQIAAQWVNGSSFDWDNTLRCGCEYVGRPPRRDTVATYRSRKSALDRVVRSSGRCGPNCGCRGARHERQ